MSPKRSLNALLVFRVSTEEQKRAQTIDSQVPVVERLVTEHGLKVVARAWDEGKSGTKLAGREFGSRLTEIESGSLHIDRIVTVDMDRLFRLNRKSRQSRDDAHRLESVLLDHGVKVVTATGIVDPERTLEYLIHQAIAAEEWEKIRGRMIRGKLDDLTTQNKWVYGSVPLGYVRVYGGKERRRGDYTVEQDPGQVKVLLKVLRSYAEHGVEGAAKRLHQQKVATRFADREYTSKTPRKRYHDPKQGWDACKWGTGTILRIAQRIDAYRSGDWPYRFQGEDVVVKLPPVEIPDDLFLAVRSRLKSRKTREDHNVFASTGTVVCSLCGKGVQTLAVAGRYHYVRCQRCRKNVLKATFDQLLWPATLIRLAEVFTAEEPKAPNYAAQLAAKTEAIKRIDARILDLSEQRADGLPRDVFRERLASLNADRSQVEAEVRTLERTRDAKVEETIRSRSLGQRVAEICGGDLGSTDEPARQEVIRQLLGTDRIVCHWEPELALTYPARGTLPARTWKDVDPAELRAMAAVALASHGCRVVTEIVLPEGPQTSKPGTPEQQERELAIREAVEGSGKKLKVKSRTIDDQGQVVLVAETAEG